MSIACLALGVQCRVSVVKAVYSTSEEWTKSWWIAPRVCLMDCIVERQENEQIWIMLRKGCKTMQVQHMCIVLYRLCGTVYDLLVRAPQWSVGRPRRSFAGHWRGIRGLHRTWDLILSHGTSRCLARLHGSARRRASHRGGHVSGRLVGYGPADSYCT